MKISNIHATSKTGHLCKPNEQSIFYCYKPDIEDSNKFLETLLKKAYDHNYGYKKVSLLRSEYEKECSKKSAAKNLLTLDARVEQLAHFSTIGASAILSRGASHFETFINAT